MHNIEEYRAVSEIRYAVDKAIKYYNTIYNPDKNGFDERFFNKIKFLTDIRFLIAVLEDDIALEEPELRIKNYKVGINE